MESLDLLGNILITATLPEAAEENAVAASVIGKTLLTLVRRVAAEGRRRGGAGLATKAWFGVAENVRVAAAVVEKHRNPRMIKM